MVLLVGFSHLGDAPVVLCGDRLSTSGRLDLALMLSLGTNYFTLPFLKLAIEVG
jgi:hypothetical protein